MVGIIVNIASFLLAIYLSIRKTNEILFKIWKIRITMQLLVWSLAFLITIGNFYEYFQEKNKEVIYFDILTPHITSKEAIDLLKSAEKENIEGYDLIDVIGSYYICLKKPNIFFHRFPEWIFIFRKSDNTSLVEYRVYDDRIPELPEIDISEVKHIYGGQLVGFFNFKVSFEFLGIDNPYNTRANTIAVIFDEEGRSLIEIHGVSPNDDIPEVIESVNTKVIARVRVVGRPTDHVNEMTVIENPINFGKIVVAKAEIQTNQFYELLYPITDWKIDVEDAIKKAINKGAKAIPPGKSGMAGGPGVFRLYNTKIHNLQGAFWDIPYRIGIRPVLIDASSGEVYAVNNHAEYSTKWEKDLDIEISLNQKKPPLENPKLPETNATVDTIDFLIKCLTHVNAEVRFSAAKAMQNIRDERIIEPLIKALEDPDPTVQFTAALTLGHIGDKRAVKPLIKNLDAEDRIARHGSVKALGLLGDTLAINKLKSLSDYDPEPIVVIAAKEAIKQIRIRQKQK